ncbi:ribosomal small subunit protein bTHX [Aureitalea marina]|uniref:Ribosomal small subunit protein bTHX n=1 Tax=Aureitalea marina TaxID=930804 RepID=A0A2S7KQH7_9FLAO|nr:ribosomal small subunit protein bTHX [Aureitalea marina]
MGKGDMKTRKGKISRGTYGKLRPRKPDQLKIEKPAAKKKKSATKKK